MSRRLPIYIVVDTTEALAGEPIEAVNYGINSLVQALRGDPYALETAWLSVIGIGDDVKRLTPMQEICGFKVPQLTPEGKCPRLDPVFHFLAHCVRSDLVPTTKEIKGDQRPVIIFILFGEFTAPSAGALMLLKDLRPGAVIPYGGMHACEALKVIGRAFPNDRMFLANDFMLASETDSRMLCKVLYDVYFSDFDYPLSFDQGTQIIEPDLPPPPPEFFEKL